MAAHFQMDVGKWYYHEIKYVFKNENFYHLPFFKLYGGEKKDKKYKGHVKDAEKILKIWKSFFCACQL